MSNKVIYEVSLRVPLARSGELADWLSAHIEEMLALPGFIEANNFGPQDDEQTHHIHSVQYILTDQSSLDLYLANDAERMREHAVDLFGDDLSASRRVLQLNSRERASYCLNCDATLSGQYCWNCGQRGNTRLISLWELLREAFGDLFEMDSRFWRTLRPLFLRPGYLTAEYLIGRRTRYMPPFRMYLVLSFVFFLITAMFSGDSVFNTLLAEPDAQQSGLTVEFPGAQEIDASATETDVATTADPPVEPTPAIAGDQTDSKGNGQCTIDVGKFGPQWFQRRFSDERVSQMCEKIVADNGRRMLSNMVDNSPAALLALLPLLALLLKSLYPLSRRYYVEHLLMLVHYHSFVFLNLSMLVLFTQLADGMSFPDWIVVVVSVIASLYIPIYLYKAMRKVYGQGRILTIFKYIAVFMGYLLGAVFMAAIVSIFALLAL